MSLDANGDGKLCLFELERAFTRLFRQPKREQLHWLLQKYDKVRLRCICIIRHMLHLDELTCE